MLARMMEDAVGENFEQQGRPKWLGWSPRYARRRGRVRYCSDLVGWLRASLQYSDNDMATVGTNVIYAGIHQSGGKISIPARSQQAYYRQNKDGTLNNQFARKSKANYAEWNTIPAYEIKMPARPFLFLAESDVSAMEEKSVNYFSQIYR